MEEKYRKIIHSIKEDRQRMFDKYEKIGILINMPLKYVKRREVKEIVIFSDEEIDEKDDSLFIEEVPEQVFEFKEQKEENPELSKGLEELEKALKKDAKPEKKGLFGRFKRDKK